MAIVLKVTYKDHETEVEVKKRLSIGRSSKADFKIKDGSLSSEHGVFKIDVSGKLFYEDLSSSNGSYLNGTGIYASQFMIEDVLKVGETEIWIDLMSLTTSERHAIGRRVGSFGKKKDITFIKD